MNVVYTIHAEETVKLRHLSTLQIEACVRHPDEIIPARHGKTQYIKDCGTNYLKVIVSEEQDSRIVITAYWFAKKRKIR